MKTVTFYKNEQLQLGVKTDRGILDVEEASTAFEKNLQGKRIPLTVKEMIEGGTEATQALEALVNLADERNEIAYLSEESLTLGPCVDEPQKIICVGLNYQKHAEESNMEPPKYPLLFSKFNNALTGHNSDVKLPEKSTQVDYEAELVIVMGKEARNVSRADALSYVYGYCNANDISARDLQFLTPQWLLGKTCDGFCPVGPYLVSADEVGDPNNLHIQATVNGDVRQSSNTSDMIFHCDEIISFASQHMTLYPGDIILTGTPEGVIAGYDKDKQVWLADGDSMTIEIEKLGALTNKMVK